MAEQTRVKNLTAQEKYLDELRDTDAYKLLRYALLHGELCGSNPEFRMTVARFLDTGIVESIYGRDYYLGR